MKCWTDMAKHIAVPRVAIVFPYRHRPSFPLVVCLLCVGGKYWLTMNEDNLVVAKRSDNKDDTLLVEPQLFPYPESFDPYGNPEESCGSAPEGSSGQTISMLYDECLGTVSESVSVQTIIL